MNSEFRSGILPLEKPMLDQPLTADDPKPGYSTTVAPEGKIKRRMRQLKLESFFCFTTCFADFLEGFMSLPQSEPLSLDRPFPAFSGSPAVV